MLPPEFPQFQYRILTKFEKPRSLCPIGSRPYRASARTQPEFTSPLRNFLSQILVVSEHVFDVSNAVHPGASDVSRTIARTRHSRDEQRSKHRKHARPRPVGDTPVSRISSEDAGMPW